MVNNVLNWRAYEFSGENSLLFAFDTKRVMDYLRGAGTLYHTVQYFEAS